MAMDYNTTINLPQTDFPMRAGLPKREPEMLAQWKKIDVYKALLKKNEGKPRFSLHDGPPFSNGALHMGHALNKAIKDFITRSYAMRGYYTPYIPGCAEPHWGQTSLLLWETFGRFLFLGLKFEKSLYNLNAMEKVFIRF